MDNLQRILESSFWRLPCWHNKFVCLSLINLPFASWLFSAKLQGSRALAHTVLHTGTAITSTHFPVALQYTKPFCTPGCHSLISSILTLSLWSISLSGLTIQPVPTKHILAFPSESAGSGNGLDVCLGLYLGREWCYSGSYTLDATVQSVNHAVSFWRRLVLLRRAQRAVLSSFL